MSYRDTEFIEGGIYHIYNRGVAKLPIYHSVDDYQDFQDILHYLLIGFSTSERSDLYQAPCLPVSRNAKKSSNGLFRNYIDLLAYTLMPNHFHFLVRLVNPDGKLELGNGKIRSFQPLPEFIKRLCITYAMKFNQRHNRQGVLLQSRYCVKLVETDEYGVQVGKYIHLNPVTAKLVKSPEDWPYSDFSLYTSPVKIGSLPLTKPDFILDYFKTAKEYVEFVRAGIAIDEASAIAAYTIDHSFDD